jgi:hypothetical protein
MGERAWQGQRRHKAIAAQTQRASRPMRAFSRLKDCRADIALLLTPIP